MAANPANIVTGLINYITAPTHWRLSNTIKANVVVALISLLDFISGQWTSLGLQSFLPPAFYTAMPLWLTALNIVIRSLFPSAQPFTYVGPGNITAPTPAVTPPATTGDTDGTDTNAK